MIKITNNNAISFLIQYFASQDIDLSQLKKRKIRKALIKKLPACCLLKKNKPKGFTSNQTHIHITGDGMLVIASEDELSSDKNIDYYRQDIIVSESNIRLLLEQEHSHDPNFMKSFLYKKIAVRADGSVQVQISQIQKDDSKFLELREGLYENDYLVILQDENDEIIVLGIRGSDVNDKFDLPKKLMTDLGDEVIDYPKETVVNSEEMAVKDDIDEDIQDLIFEKLVNEIEIDSEKSFDDDENMELSDGYIGTTNSKRGRSNPQKTAEVIAQAGYKCFFEEEGNPHTTFLKENGQVYMEGHHLIPLGKQAIYQLKLDKKPNIVCLCPNCHAKIHHGRKEDVKKMLDKILEARRGKLMKCGLIVSNDQLYEFYNLN